MPIDQINNTYFEMVEFQIENSTYLGIKRHSIISKFYIDHIQSVWSFILCIYCFILRENDKRRQSTFERKRLRIFAQTTYEKGIRKEVELFDNESMNKEDEKFWLELLIKCIKPSDSNKNNSKKKFRKLSGKIIIRDSELQKAMYSLEGKNVNLQSENQEIFNLSSDQMI